MLNRRPEGEYSADPAIVVANLAGPALLDALHPQFSSTEPVSSGLLSGAIASAHNTPHGQNVAGIGEYSPGYDAPTQIDIAATFAADGRTMARKVRSGVDMTRLHIVADLPERLRHTTGDMTLYSLGRLGVAYGLLLAQKSVRSVSVVENGEIFFDDAPSEGYAAMNELDRRFERKNLVNQDDSPSSLARSLEAVKPEIGDNDVALVLTDAMDGYNGQISQFDWEGSLKDIHAQLGDRLIFTRLSSPSQRVLPTGVAPGLSIAQVSAIRRGYADMYDRKDQSIQRLLGHGIRHAQISSLTTSERRDPLGSMYDALIEAPTN